MSAINSDPNPKINLVSLVRRTVAKVMMSAGIPETAGSYRIVASVLINMAAEYVIAAEDDPKHIEALFHVFLTGTEDEQRAAVKKFGDDLAAADVGKEKGAAATSTVLSP